MHINLTPYDEKYTLEQVEQAITNVRWGLVSENDQYNAFSHYENGLRFPPSELDFEEDAWNLFLQYFLGI